MKNKTLIMLLALTMSLPSFYGTADAQGFRNSSRAGGGGGQQSAPAPQTQQQSRPAPQPAPRPQPVQRPQPAPRTQPVQRARPVERPQPVQREERPAPVPRPQPQSKPSESSNSFRQSSRTSTPQAKPSVQTRPTPPQSKPGVKTETKPSTPAKPQESAKPKQPEAVRITSFPDQSRWPQNRGGSNNSSGTTPTAPKQSVQKAPESKPANTPPAANNRWPQGRPGSSGTSAVPGQNVQKAPEKPSGTTEKRWPQNRPGSRPSGTTPPVQRPEPKPTPEKPSVRPTPPNPSRPNRPPVVRPGGNNRPTVVRPNRPGGRPPVIRPGGQRPPHMGRPPIHRPPTMHPRPPFRPPYRPPHRPIYRPWYRPGGWNIFIGSGNFYLGYGWNDWYRPSWYYPGTTIIYNEVQPEPAVINNYYAEQPPVLKNYNFYEGIKYNPLSSHPELKLDVYAPIARTIGGSPCVVLIPDGEWEGNYEKDLSSAAEYLVSKGYLCVSVSYRKYPNSKIKDSVEDVMRALYWVKNNAVKYGGDPKKIGVVGVGGGGYLAEMLAVKSTQSRSGDVNPVLGSVSAVVAIGSPSDVYNYGVLVGSERVERDLGSDSSQSGVFEGGVVDFSPISQVGSYTPPILLIHADNDYVVPCELSERMKSESDARSAKVEFKTIDSDEHRIWMSPADSYNVSTPIWDEVSLFLANKMKVQ